MKQTLIFIGNFAYTITGILIVISFLVFAVTFSRQMDRIEEMQREIKYDSKQIQAAYDSLIAKTKTINLKPKNASRLH